MTKLSIIIPIYKVEKYIVECIESICCQLVEGVEVILVNDGTPDRSMEMAKDYISNKYYHYLSRFVFIDQENQGQSAARNIALKKAKGKHIAFVDSDDILKSTYLLKIIEVIDKEYPDIIRFNADRFINNANDFSEFINFKGLGGLNENREKSIAAVFKQCAWCPWLNVYKRELFLYEKFPIGMYFEDAWLIAIVIKKKKKIVFLDNSLYLYRYNLNSSLNDKCADNLFKLNQSYVKIIEAYQVRLKDNYLYSKSYIGFLMSYTSFLLSNKKYLEAIKFSKKRKYGNVRIDQLERSSKAFYYLGLVFISFYKFIGRI